MPSARLDWYIGQGDDIEIDDNNDMLFVDKRTDGSKFIQAKLTKEGVLTIYWNDRYWRGMSGSQREIISRIVEWFSPQFDISHQSRGYTRIYIRRHDCSDEECSYKWQPVLDAVNDYHIFTFDGTNRLTVPVVIDVWNRKAISGLKEHVRHKKREPIETRW